LDKVFPKIEVCNGETCFPEAHQWCLDKNLTMLGNSDIHGPDVADRTTPGQHRTMTLAFAKERTLESLKEALQAGRTVVWSQDQLIGRREWLEPLSGQCVHVLPSAVRSKNAVWARMRNGCDIDVKLERSSGTGPEELTLPARTTSLVKIPSRKPNQPIELHCTVRNFLIAPRQSLSVTLRISG